MKSEATYKAGQLMFGEGQEAYSVFLILSGEVEILVDGKQIDVRGSGDIVGEMALCSGQKAPRCADVRATVDTKVEVLTKEAFWELVENGGQQTVSIVRNLIRRLQETTRLLPRAE